MEWLNARLGPADIERVCRILKVARTIADMEGSDEICEEHLAEAVSFRKWGASVPDFLLDV
jgi:predicted ATPase with chaperone activity